MASALLCTALLIASAVLAALLARSAARRWRAERAGLAYELPADYRAATVRAVAAGVVLIAAVVFVVRLPDGAPRAGTASAAALPASLPAHRARPATVDTAPLTIAHPAGGVLQELSDGTHVWLPPQYAYPRAATRTFALVVAYLPEAAPDREDLYPAFAEHTASGYADPFVVVLPRDCAADPQEALAAAARHYRIVPGPSARGVVGVGPLAPCAVRAVLDHPERYAAAAAVSGLYDTGDVAVPSRPLLPGPRLLLASTVGEDSQSASDLRLREALRPSGARVRVIDQINADPGLGGGPLRRALALASGYLTEQLEGPGHLAIPEH